jgi:quercetin dioxygenase-like cupin family protein
MRCTMWVLCASAIALGAYSAEHRTRVADAAGITKATPLIVAENEGERREFRTRPGTYFTLKVDPKNGGSEHMTVVAEDMAPGDRIPTHRHPNADELIIIHTGTARVTLGDNVQEAQAGAIVFIPAGTWIGVENIGKGHLISTGVFSAPGYEEYLRAISVPVGQTNTPLSKTELEEIRKKHLHDAIYQ